MDPKLFRICLAAIAAVLVLGLVGLAVRRGAFDPGPRTNLEVPQRGM